MYADPESRDLATLGRPYWWQGSHASPQSCLGAEWAVFRQMLTSLGDACSVCVTYTCDHERVTTIGKLHLLSDWPNLIQVDLDWDVLKRR